MSVKRLVALGRMAANTSARSTYIQPLSILMIGLSLVGQPACAADVVGFGNNIPLSFAVQQVIPAGYHVQYGPGVSDNTIVSWTGGAPWQDVVASMLQASGMTDQINGRIVEIENSNISAAPSAASAVGGPGLSIQTAASMPAPVSPLGGGLTIEPSAPAPVVDNDVAANNSAGVSVGPVEATKPNYLPTVSATASQPLVSPVASRIPGPPQTATVSPTTPSIDGGVWVVHAGQNLNDVLAVWAHQAGWTLAYNTDIIYPLQANAELNGDFISAVTAVIDSIHANPRPFATFYKGNNALVVSDANHISQSQGQ